jgi:hypothetical protein
VRHRLPYFDVHSEWLAAQALIVSSQSSPHNWKVLPYPLIVVLVTAIAAAPWIRWRFSLRTLLIATTLVAVVLGLICYAMR